MGIESLFALPAGTTAQAGAKSGPVQGQPGLEFLSLILSRLGTETQKAAVTPTDLPAQPQANGAKVERTPLSDFLSAHPDIAADIRQLIESAEPGADLETLEIVSLDLGDAALANDSGLITTDNITPETGSETPLLQIVLLEGPIDNKSGDKITGILNALKQRIEKIIKNGENAVVATNLTPEQITALQNAQDGQWPEELKGVHLVLVALAPAGETPAPADTATTETDPATEAALASVMILMAPPKPEQTKPTGDALAAGEIAQNAEDAISAKLNSLTPGAIGEQTDSETTDSLGEFDGILKDLGDGKKIAKGNDNAQAGNADKPHSAQKNNAATLPGFSAVTALPYGTDALYGPMADSLGLYDDLAAASVAASPLHSAGLTSLVSAAPGASLPHPATQALAVNIQKAASEGGDKTVSLELDPPELGRVEVRLTFAKDKSMKAHVIAEKPETYMMLQRDSDTLQRALQASGLEGDGGLSFELAEHGFDFNGDNQRGGGHDSGGTGSGGAKAEVDITETTLTWHIDPQTGLTRYDFYA